MMKNASHTSSPLCPPECKCYRGAFGGPFQNFEEVEFLRSACSAAQKGDTQRLQKILDRHPEAVDGDGGSGVDPSGYSPLHYAARTGSLDCLRLLIARGADVNRRTRAGQATPLHRAAYMGHSEVVRALLFAGAEAGPQDSDGQTPLHKACEAGHQEAAFLLVSAAPSTALLPDRKGRTPLELMPALGGAPGVGPLQAAAAAAAPAGITVEAQGHREGARAAAGAASSSGPAATEPSLPPDRPTEGQAASGSGGGTGTAGSVGVVRTVPDPVASSLGVGMVFCGDEDFRAVPDGSGGPGSWM